MKGQDDSEFEELKKAIEANDSIREDLIAKSRQMIKDSKKAIYALQRNDPETAKATLKKMKAGMTALQKFESDSNFASTIRPAMQEFVEAACFNEFSSTGRMLPRSELGVSAENYLLGLCDLSGEIVRKAVNSAINDDTKTVLAAKLFIEKLYYGMLQFDLRNSELRRKFDGLKYDLKKMEDLVLSLKLQGKVK